MSERRSGLFGIGDMAIIGFCAGARRLAAPSRAGRARRQRKRQARTHEAWIILSTSFHSNRFIKAYFSRPWPVNAQDVPVRRRLSTREPGGHSLIEDNAFRDRK